MLSALRLTALCAALVFTGAARAADVPAAVSAAVADKGRPAADTARDANRKPTEVVAFAGLKAGDKVADISPGGGYFTRILSKVVGPSGKVYGVISALALSNRPALADGIKALEADAQYGNIVFIGQDYDKLSLTEPLDVVWISLIYHDVMNRDPAATAGTNKAMFAALKPGGTYIVIDHTAEAGSGARDTNTLHRIDPALVKQEVLAAGFTLEAESKILAHPADDLKTKVFDGAIRGKTDQFIYKFRKPLR